MCDGNCAGELRLGRRDFLNAAALSAVAALLAGCGDGEIGGLAAGRVGVPISLSVRLADYPALAQVGGIARIAGSPAPLAVVRVSASEYRALSLSCPHSGTTVNVSGASFLCPNHKARFAADGTWTGGKQTSSLVALPVTLDAATGMLSITGTTRPPRQGDDDEDTDGK